MTRSKFLVAWVLGHVILFSGMISLFAGVILWIGAMGGLTIFGEIRVYTPNPDAQTRQMLFDNIIISLFIISWGIFILYLRRKTDPNHADNRGIWYELFLHSPNTRLGNLGGVITMIGLGWFLLIIQLNTPLPSLISLIIGVHLFPLLVGQVVVLLPNVHLRRIIKLGAEITPDPTSRQAPHVHHPAALKND